MAAFAALAGCAPGVAACYDHNVGITECLAGLLLLIVVVGVLVNRASSH